jgi:hypothetical protein
MKIRPVIAELFHADGQTNILTKLIVAFRILRKRLTIKPSQPDVKQKQQHTATAGHVRPRQASHAREARGIGPQHG